MHGSYITIYCSILRRPSMDTTISLLWKITPQIRDFTWLFSKVTKLLDVPLCVRIHTFLYTTPTYFYVKQKSKNSHPCRYLRSKFKDILFDTQISSHLSNIDPALLLNIFSLVILVFSSYTSIVSFRHKRNTFNHRWVHWSWRLQYLASTLNDYFYDLLRWILKLLN